MNRDYPAIEAALKAIEDADSEWDLKEAMQPVIESFGYDKVRHQLRILEDGGFLEIWTAFENSTALRSDEIHSQAAGRLTWKGHDFLDAIRENEGDYGAALEEVSGTD